MTQPRIRRRTRPTSGGFMDQTPKDLADMHEAHALAEASRVDEIVAKYTGSAINLEEAFPEPPEAPPAHVALRGAVRNPYSDVAYQRPDPAQAEALAAENAYRREHELRLVHRMLMRNATMPQIANALDKALPYVLALRHELERRLAAEAANINVMAHSASSIGFYREVRGIALRNVDAEGMGHRDKARYMTLALAAENNLHRFLQATGFYDSAHMRPQEVDPDGGEDMAVLTGALKALMNPDAYEDAAYDVVFGDDPEDLSTGSPEDHIRVL